MKNISKALLLASLTVCSTGASAARGGNFAANTWHGGIVGVDVCYNDQGNGFSGPHWKFAGVPAVPCFSQ